MSGYTPDLSDRFVQAGIQAGVADKLEEHIIHITPTGVESSGLTQAQINGIKFSVLGAGLTPPSGLSWLTTLLNGLDIWQWFVKRPTIYFDPSLSAATSMGTGDAANPYYLVADVIARCSGNMSGQTLGIKRGTTTRHSGLILNVCGSPGSSFTICPYGDNSLPLPIITTGVVVKTWAQTGFIWSYVVGATEHDVWQADQRLWKKAWNTSAAVTLTGPGQSTYNANTLYIWPYNSDNPNQGQVEVSTADCALQITYPNVATTGYVTICGLDLRKARNSVLNISSSGSIGSITACGGISIVGNRMSGGGMDGSGQGCDGVLHYGPSDAVRSTSPYIAANYVTDVLNNAYEIAGTTGATIEYNQSYGIGGNLIAELWASNSNALVRYNYGNYASTFGRVYTGYNSSAVWFANSYWDGSSWDTLDATNTKNSGNKVVFNVAVNVQKSMVRASGGTGHVCQQNTFIADHDLIFGASDGANTNIPAGLYTDGTAATGFLNWSNNLLYWKASINPNGYLNPSFINVNSGIGAANCVPSGDYNVYMHQTGNGTANFRFGSSMTSMTAYKTAAVSYALDQHSLANSALVTGGGVTLAALGFNESSLRPLKTGATGLTTLTTIGTMYQDGQPYIPGQATIGALRGT